MKRRQYEIRVEGRLGTSWVDWFEGLEIRDEPDPEGVYSTTVLSGVMDQSALHGTLGKIRDLGIPLLSVRIKTLLENPRSEASLDAERPTRM
jgi:hypothetical protein